MAFSRTSSVRITKACWVFVGVVTLTSAGGVPASTTPAGPFASPATTAPEPTNAAPTPPPPATTVGVWKQKRFHRVGDTKLVGCDFYSETDPAIAHTWLRCCTLCLYDTSCFSVNYHKVTKRCYFSSSPLFRLHGNMEGHSDWDLFSRDDYQLVFHAEPGLETDIYTAWEIGQNCTDLESRVHETAPILENYGRLPNLHQDWDTFRDFVVFYGLFVNIDGLPASAAAIEFNGTGSNMKSWFSADLIVNTWWPELQEPNCCDKFEMQSSGGRRFMIASKVETTCGYDSGYSVLIQDGTYSQGGCTYDQTPAFLYSRGTSVLFDNTSTTDYIYKADLMAIFLRSV